MIKVSKVLLAAEIIPFDRRPKSVEGELVYPEIDPTICPECGQPGAETYNGHALRCDECVERSARQDMRDQYPELF